MATIERSRHAPVPNRKMNILPGNNFDLELFKNPPADCQPSYSWLWNVPVSREAIDRELEEIVRAGVKSLYILPMPKDFRPETIRTYLDPDYLTEEFVELAKYAIERMIDNGITPWLYDEGGWPSGSACGKTLLDYPDGAMTLLRKRILTLKAGEKFQPADTFVAAFIGKARIDREYVAEQDVEILEYFTRRNTELTDDHSMRGFIDFTDPKVTEAFINNTYEMYRGIVGERFGKEIPLIFTDEPGLKEGALPKGCFEEFKKEFGYDIRDFAYVLLDKGSLAETEEEISARRNFIEMVGRKFKDATFVRLRKWCDDAGICYAGHLMADNYPDAYRSGYFSQLDILRQMAIPGVDAIWEQIRYPYGGRAPYDAVETERMPFFPRIASSAARQTGQNISLTETMGIYGDGVTPDEIRFGTNYHVIRGINYVSFAHIPFGNQRFSALATRPDYRHEKPGFYNLAHINDYFARLSYLARLGHADGDTALYHPINDYPTNPEISEAAVKSYRDTGVMLEKNFIQFDIIDDYAIRAAEIAQGGLKIGDAVYRHIVVPENKYMPEDIKEKIAPYVSEGNPEYKFSSDKIRVMTRKLDTGRLWFIFNEGEPTVREALTIGGRRKVYRLDCSTAEIYRDDTPEMVLPCGDIAVYFVTDEELPAVSKNVEYTVETGELVPFAHKRFIIDYYKLKNEFGDGSIVPNENFSGEISYKASYNLKSEPKADERYKLTLEGFATTASVRLGGKTLTFGLSPMEAIVDGSLLKGSGELEITVCNTAVNEIKAKAYLKELYPKAELPFYVSKTEQFEKNSLIKTGRIFISKMAD